MRVPANLQLIPLTLLISNSSLYSLLTSDSPPPAQLISESSTNPANPRFIPLPLAYR